MRKHDLSRALSEEFELPLAESARIVAFIFSTIARLLLAGGAYQHSGFGSFSVSRRRKRRSHDVNRGVCVMIPEKKGLRFTPSKTLKRKLNEKRRSKTKRAHEQRL